MPDAALDNWQPVWNAQVSISTRVCVNFELRPGAGDIHICRFNFEKVQRLRLWNILVQEYFMKIKNTS